MMELVFATNNKHKLQEASQVLPEDLLLLNLDDIGCEEELAETADTFQGNALMKAEYVFKNYEVACFADDSGLEVDALNGAPGVYSARYAGEHGNAEKNMDKLLEALKGSAHRKARFKTVIALVQPQGVHYFEGSVEGHILEEKRGDRGFGYDPLFVPEGETRSFAEMSPSEKNSMSHRARALAKMHEFLSQQ
ncbi:MAG: non-canonical purine NTP diphosphatase [Bacteroidetes bacterium]|nr:MAG: non-canonical purine NTP diphosphatase [Bacteroidota bacterium]